MKTSGNRTTKLVAWSLCFMLFFNSSRAQYVTLPDTNFVNWLNANGYAGCLNGNQLDTTCAAVLNTTVMSCSAVPIRDLTGLQYFKNLQSLDCSNDSVYFIPAFPAGMYSIDCEFNNLTTLPTLPDSLDYLECSINAITSLPNLPARLSYFGCSQNGLTTLPALPVELNAIDCSSNPLSFLPVLPNSLASLDCSNSLSITNLPTLPSGLQYLDCSFDSIPNLPVLPPTLQTLKCANDLLTQLPSLPPTITELDCDQNAITVLPTLPDSLVTFLCELNQITIMPALPPNVQTIICWGNQLTNMPVLPSHLATLDCDQNNISSIPGPLPQSLTDFEFGTNRITSLPALPDSLYWFDCSANQLSSLPSLPATLTYINCSNNLLTSIPPLPDSLYTLNCGGNASLTCLPELKKIASFYFSGTAITCLPDYGIINFSYPPLNSVPLCDIFNENGCQPYWNITGQIFYDSNANCTFDTIDVGQEYVKVQLNGGGFQQQVYSSYSGVYSFLADNNINYTIGPDTSNLPFIVTCPGAGYRTTALTSADSFMSYNNNFALQCRTDGIDVGVQSILPNYIIPWPAANFTLLTTAGDISQLYGAHCAAGNSGQVQLIYTGEIIYHGVAQWALTPTSVTGDTITWNIPDFGAINDLTAFNTLFAIDSSASAAGTQVCFTMHVTTSAYDFNTDNNTGYFCFTIVDALDPNEKEVSPAGNIDSTQWLTYTIRFQNTGTAPAQNIRINDTLDNHLDPSTFQLTAYSAKNLTQLFGNVVVFNFPNINLPDSLTSDSASRGYVQYKIKPKDGMQRGTQIKNTASIYFGLNPAVVTNTTSSTFGFPTDIKPIAPDDGPITFNLYPNPAKGYATIETNILVSGATIVVTDITGKEVMKLPVNYNREQIPLTSLAPGLYIVKLSNNEGRMGVEKLVIQ